MKRKPFNPSDIPVGVISNEEIAKFLGLSIKTFLNNKNKYLAELDPYVKYRVFPGGVDIYTLKG